MYMQPPCHVASFSQGDPGQLTFYAPSAVKEVTTWYEPCHMLSPLQLAELPSVHSALLTNDKRTI
jgi:hypothetical protein